MKRYEVIFRNNESGKITLENFKSENDTIAMVKALEIFSQKQSRKGDFFRIENNNEKNHLAEIYSSSVARISDCGLADKLDVEQHKSIAAAHFYDQSEN